MSDNLDFNLKNYTFDFSDGQVKQFRSLISDLYKLLKDVYDRPRRQYQRYSSFVDYKVKRQRIYLRPDEFYRFVFDNITVHNKLNHNYNHAQKKKYNYPDFQDIYKLFH